jgi:hypothetical protein
MRRLLIVFLGLSFFSCKKEDDQLSSKRVDIRYSVTANHLPIGAGIERWKTIGTETDFTDTVFVSLSDRTITETIYYAQCPEDLVFGARILNDTLSADSLYVEIFVNGNLYARGDKIGKAFYYRSEITTQINW